MDVLLLLLNTLTLLPLPQSGPLGQQIRTGWVVDDGRAQEEMCCNLNGQTTVRSLMRFVHISWGYYKQQRNASS